MVGWGGAALFTRRTRCYRNYSIHSNTKDGCVASKTPNPVTLQLQPLRARQHTALPRSATPRLRGVEIKTTLTIRRPACHRGSAGMLSFTPHEVT